MNSLFLGWIMAWGAWFIADGLSSIWSYHGKETFWRNQSFRVFRMIGGAIVVTLASLLMRS